MRRVLSSGSAKLIVSSVAARLAILAVLVAASRSIDTPQYHALTYMLAVSTAAQVLVDPGTANWLMRRWSQVPAMRSMDWISGMKLHGMAAFLVVVITTAVGLATGGLDRLGLAASLGVLSAAEGLARVGRVPWQSQLRFTRVMSVDFAIAAMRLLTTVALIASSAVGVVFCLANVAAAGVSLGLAGLAFSELPHAGATMGLRLREVLSEIWPYSTFLPSLYAQAPAILIGLFGSVEAAAVYAICSRVTQPTELVPLAISNARLPLLVASDGQARASAFRRQVIITTGVALATAIAVIGASPLILWLFHVSYASGGATLIILSVVLVPKFLSYQLVALCVAEDNMRQRFLSAAIVAVISLTATCIVARFGATWTAAISLLSELTLCALLVRGNAVVIHRAIAI